MRKINNVIIHCTDTYADMDIGIDTVRQWHVNERKWSDVGYHFLIRRSGELEVGRAEQVAGAHAAGKNKHSIGVALVGGKGHGKELPTNFTVTQWSALEQLVRDLVDRYPKAEVIGHNDCSPKTCPTFDGKAWWQK